MKSRLIFKNTISRLIFSTFNLLLGFIVTPLLIHFLGKEDFSLYKLTIDWLSSVGFLEQALTSSVLVILFESSDQKRDHIIYYTYKYFFRFALFFMLLTLTLIPLLPYLYAIPKEKLFEVRTGFFIGSLTFLFLPITVLRLWIEFHEKSYLLNSSRMIQNIFQSIIALLLAWLSFGIIGQFSSLLIGQFLFAIIIFYLFRKSSALLPQDELKELEKKEFHKRLWSSNKNGFILSLSSKLSFFSDTLLLGFFFKPVLILPFALTQKLTQMIQENLQSLGNSSWASLIDLYRKGMQKEFEEQLISLTRIIVFFFLTLCLPILFLNKAFIVLWVGHQFYAGFAITLIAVINTYFMSIFSLWGWCLSGSGKITIQIPIYLINALVNFSVGLIFIKFSGLAGPIIGTLVGFLTVYSWLIPRALERELGILKSKMLKNLFIPFTMIIPAAIAAWKWQDHFNASGYTQWILQFAALALITMVILLLVYLNKEERVFLKNLFSKKFQL